MSAPETYPVSLCIRAVEMAMQDCDAATPGPWRYIEHGAIRGGKPREYANGVSDEQLALMTCRIHVGNPTQERDANARFAVLARAGFRAALEYLRDDLTAMEGEMALPHHRRAVAPLIQHYDATRPGWRTA